jgi:hypothetical protein
MRRPLVSLTCLALATPVVAEEQPQRQPYVMFGTCDLARDPETAAGRDQLGFNVCIRGNVGAEMTFVSGAPEENSWLRYANLYGGVFVTPWMSVQARGKLRDTLPIGIASEENLDRRTDYAVLQLGSPVIHHTRLTAGRLRLPFGIDRSEATEFYKSFENRTFWDSPPDGAYVTFDEMRNLRLDLGYASNQLVEESVTDPLVDEKEEVRAGSVRLMIDFSALDGSRLVFSGYGENHGVRRMGAGFVTVSRKSDMTLFEFVRKLSTPSGDDAPFEQLLRLGYVSAYRNDTRWVVQFDDERFRFRRGIVAHDFLIYDHFDVRLGVTYQKSETGDGLKRWYITSGLEARL